MRLLKILAGAAVLATGAAFAPYCLDLAKADDLSSRLSAGADAAMEVAAGAHPFESSARASESSDPFQLRVLSKVAYYVGEDYVDASRVDPTKMLKSSMDALQRGIAEVQVEHLPGDQMKVHVGSQEKVFSGKVRNIDEMVVRLKEVFAFLKTTLPPQQEPEDLEYAAIGGMLSTLDPHSVLLPPEVYDEMKLSTSGEFGGLGIVIAIRDGSLTVISPLDDTPASRAGIKSGDKITKIGEESTVNMNLEEAVKKLRGPKGTAVTIGVLRKGMAEAKEYTLIRDTIRIVNVEGQLLSDNIGYIRVKGFQEDTGEDVRKQMDAMRQKSGGKLRGVVLDLRNNPGGLLDEAIKLSDLFLESGPIVTTVGVGNKLRDEKNARWPETDKDTPVVVLTNGGSASASEIVAGALKNRDRAVLLGEQTFGKGSVQNLFDLRDGSALKLTIAKYLTPGDVSIQSVGVTPDIETIPVKVTDKHVDLTGESRKFREADLELHFDSDDRERATKDKPVLSLRFLDAEDNSNPPRDKYTPLNPKEGKDPKDTTAPKTPGKTPGTTDKTPAPETPVDEDDVDPEYRKIADLTKDFEVQLATQLLKQAGHSSRKKMMAAAGMVTSKAAQEQDQKIVEEFRKIGVDWTAGLKEPAPKLTSVVDFGAPASGATAGDELKVTVTVTNTGSTDVTRLRGISDSDEPLFDALEFAFGRIKPGQSKSWTVPMKLPKAWPASVTEMKVDLLRNDDPAIFTVPSRLAVKPLPHPSFAYSWQVLDAAPGGNGDGIAQAGETVEMSVSVVNLGPGESPEPVAILKNLEGEAVFIDRGRIKFDPLANGKQGEGRFRFQVKEGYAKAMFDLRLTVADATFGDYVSEKIELPTGTRGQPVASAEGKVTTIGPATVHSGASDRASILAKATKGATFAVKGKIGEWTNVALPDGRTGWISSKVTASASGSASPQGIETVRNSAPKLSVGPRADLVQRAEKANVQGTATDDHGMKDLWIMVNDKKVYYRTFPVEAIARDPVTFAADLPLEKGQNRVVIFARDKSDLQSMQTFTIRREGDPSAAVPPKGSTRVQ